MIKSNILLQAAQASEEARVASEQESFAMAQVSKIIPRAPLNDVEAAASNILTELTKDLSGVWVSNEPMLYKSYLNLPIDFRGQFGELFVYRALSSIYNKGVSIEYAGGKQGPWDIKFNGIKFEVKTAAIGNKGNKFQTENHSKTNDYDALIVVGVTPNSLVLQMCSKARIPFDKLHQRSIDKFKWDFKLDEMVTINSFSEFKTMFEQAFAGLKFNPKLKGRR